MLVRVDGLMLALCGWFLVSSSGAVQRTAGVERLLEGIRVADIMDRGANRIPAGVTLDTFGDQVLTGAGDAVSVMDGAEVVGLLGSRQVRGIRRDRWATTRAGDVMARADTLPTIVPETTVRAALEHLQRTGLDGLPVTESGAITGVVTRRAVADAIRARASGRAVPS
jgi:CBS domain-containing protein